jgi:hypothetical protein
MAAAWELCQELGRLVDEFLATSLTQLAGDEAFRVREHCNRALALLSRMRNDAEEAAQQANPDE